MIIVIFFLGDGFFLIDGYINCRTIYGKNKNCNQYFKHCTVVIVTKRTLFNFTLLHCDSIVLF